MLLPSLFSSPYSVFRNLCFLKKCFLAMTCLFLEHRGGGGSCSVVYSWETPTAEGVNSVIAVQDVWRYCFRIYLYDAQRYNNLRRKVAVSSVDTEIYKAVGYFRCSKVFFVLGLVVWMLSFWLGSTHHNFKTCSMII